VSTWLRIVIQVITGVPLGVYCLGVLANLVGAFFRKRWQTAFASKHQGIDQLSQAFQGSKVTGRLIALLAAVQAVVAWPVGNLIIRRMAGRTSNLELATWLQLRPRDRSYALFSAALMVSISLLAVANLVWRPFLVVIPGLIVFGTACRHLSYLLGGLPARLRKSQWNPFQTVLIIAACDGVALVLAASLLLAPHSGAYLTLHDLRTGAFDLLAFRKLASLLHDSVGQVVIAGVGLLFYASVAKTLLTPSLYSRNGSDYSAVALALLLQGEIYNARSWALKDKDGSLLSLQTRAYVELADDHFEQAVKYATARQRIKGEDDSIDSALMYLFPLVLILADERELLQFIDNCLDVGASDANVALCLTNSLNTGIIDTDTLTALEPRLPEDTYPLSRSLVIGNSGDLDSARAILGRARPGTEIEELIRLISLSQLDGADPQISEKEQRARQRQWAADALPLIHDAVQDMPQQWKKAAGTNLINHGTFMTAYDSEVAHQLWSLGFDLSRDVMTFDEVDQWIDAQSAFVPGGKAASDLIGAAAPVGRPTLTISGRANIISSLPEPLPESVNSRMQPRTALLPHTVVLRVCVSPDGSVIGVTDKAGEVHLFHREPDGFAPMRTLHFGPQRSRKPEIKIALSDRGTRIATANGKICELWDTDSGERLIELRTPAQIRSMAITANGTLVATADKKRLAVWDAVTGDQQAEINDSGQLSHIALSPDLKMVAGTADTKGVAWLWEIDSGEKVKVLEHNEKLPWHITSHHISFSADGGHVLTAFGDGSVCLWSLAGNRPVLRLRHRREHDPAAAGWILPAALSRDNQSILVGNFKGAWLWDVGSGTLKARVSDVITSAVGFAQDGDIVLANRTDPGVKIVRWSEDLTLKAPS
jgi:WD40 repeat protein